MSEWDFERVPPAGTGRAWTDGSEQKGVGSNFCAGYGVWIGPRHQLNCSDKLPGLRQTNDRAEVTAGRAICTEDGTTMGTITNRHGLTIGGGHSAVVAARMGKERWENKVRKFG